MISKEITFPVLIEEKLCLVCSYPLSECWRIGCGMEVTNGKLEQSRREAA